MTLSEEQTNTNHRRPIDKPRGFYEVKNTWSQDTETKYFKGFMNKVGWTLIKLAVLGVFWLTFYIYDTSIFVVVLATLALVLIYQHVIAAVFGLKVMPAMDVGCYVGTSLANVNLMSVSFFDGEFTEEGLRFIYREKFIGRFDKFKYKVTMKFGDMYYEEISAKEALEHGFYFQKDPAKILTSQREIEMFVEDNINIKIPLDGPQWRFYGQLYKRPEDGKTYMLQIWKSHHSFMDGVSSMALSASPTKNYGPHLFIKFPEVKLWQKLLLKVTVPFSILMFVKNAISFRDNNILTAGKKKMTGKINSATCQPVNTESIKKVSKAQGITLNDMVMSSLSTAMHSYLGAKGDNQSLSVLMPANIRYQFYDTLDVIKLENKFSAIPIKLPLVGQIKDAYSKVSKITKQIKSSFSYVYCAYALTYWAN